MKLINDTLKETNGKWSSKRLTSLTAFVFAMTYIMVGMIMEKEIIESLVYAFLSLSGTMLGVSSWEKKNVPRETLPANE